MKSDKITAPQPSAIEIRLFETLSAIEKSAASFQAQSLVASERVAAATESMAGAISSVRALHQRLAESDRLQTESLKLAVAHEGPRARRGDGEGAAGLRFSHTGDI